MVVIILCSPLKHTLTSSEVLLSTFYERKLLLLADKAQADHGKKRYLSLTGNNNYRSSNRRLTDRLNETNPRSEMLESINVISQ